MVAMAQGGKYLEGRMDRNERRLRQEKTEGRSGKEGDAVRARWGVFFRQRG